MDIYKLEDLAKLIDRLEIICNNYDTESIDILTGNIKRLTEILIWGERNNQTFFD
jgi:hypothetical protein